MVKKLLTSRAVRWKTPSESSLWTPKLIGGIGVTIPVLCCSLFVIMSRRYRDADRKWAYGAIGTLLGFWLSGGVA
jgi:hypothetical protein